MRRPKSLKLKIKGDITTKINEIQKIIRQHFEKSLFLLAHINCTMCGI
jgi:hypothetical protein